LHPAAIVLEATGGYEVPVVAALAAAGLAPAVVNPRPVRRFAEGVGRLAKTDPLDAAVLAHFAEAVRPQPRPVPDADARLLGDLLARRRQLLQMRISEQHRLPTLRGSSARTSNAPSITSTATSASWKPS
jgi:transposase